MLIGKDFEKIEFDLFGLHLLEPNAFIGDCVILIIALYVGLKIKKLNNTKPFFIYWKWFFIVFGIGFFGGGLGHLLYNYWGLPGKYFSWYSGLVTSFLIEIAMVSIFPNKIWQKRFNYISITKLISAFIAATSIFMTVDLTEDPSKGLIIPTLNSIIGLGLTVGVLGYYYQKKIDVSFKYLWISTLILIPSAFFQAKKINFHQWFDRNDVSHVLLIISLILYYLCIKGYWKTLNSDKRFDNLSD